MIIYDEATQKAMLEAIPAIPLIHSSGYTLNMPLGFQGPPGWTRDEPELVAEILAARTAAGIVVEDDFTPEMPPAVASAVGFWDDLDEEQP